MMLVHASLFINISPTKHTSHHASNNACGFRFILFSDTKSIGINDTFPFVKLADSSAPRSNCAAKASRVGTDCSTCIAAGPRIKPRGKTCSSGEY